MAGNGLKPHIVQIGGLPHRLMLSAEDVERYNKNPDDPDTPLQVAVPDDGSVTPSADVVDQDAAASAKAAAAKANKAAAPAANK